MRKILAATTLATITAVAAATPASADITFAKPRCEVGGVASFREPLTATKAPNHYDFVSGDPEEKGAADKSKCSGTLNGVQVDELVQVRVGGDGNLSCAQSESTGEGPGTIVFLSSGVIVPFTLSFTAVATEVDLTVKGAKSGEGKGTASFARYAPPGAPLECEKVYDVNSDGKLGLTKLGFGATFSSEGTLIAPSPTGTGSGSGGGSTGGGGGGGSAGGGQIPGTVRSNVAIAAVVQKLKTALKKGVAVRLKGNVPARANLKAQLDAKTAKRYGLTKGRKPVVVATGVVALTRAGQTTGYLRLTSAAKRKLKKARRLRLKVTGTILDVTQRRQNVSKTVVLG